MIHSLGTKFLGHLFNSCLDIPVWIIIVDQLTNNVIQKAMPLGDVLLPGTSHSSLFWVNTTCNLIMWHTHKNSPAVSFKSGNENIICLIVLSNHSIFSNWSAVKAKKFVLDFSDLDSCKECLASARYKTEGKFSRVAGCV